MQNAGLPERSRNLKRENKELIKPCLINRYQWHTLEIIMNKTYKFRFYPTEEQEILLRKTIGCSRFVYNKLLEIKTKFFVEDKQCLKYKDMSLMLTNLKKQEEFRFLNEVSAVSLQQSIRNLDTAFTNYFNRKSNYPKFKKRKSGGTIHFTKSGFTSFNNQIKLAKCKEPLNIVWSRKLEENNKPSSVSITLTPSNEWYIKILADEDMHRLPKLNNSIGLDLGITHLIITSNGDKIENIRTAKKYKNKLKNAQKKLSKKINGSHNYEKARIKVAKIHKKISDTRNDNLHKVTTKLIRENQTIVVETLKVKNMVKNHKLASSIYDCSWKQLIDQLEYKSEWYGRTVLKVSAFYPSTKTCSSCGHKVDKMPLDVREWTCPTCGESHDRDINAAKNILKIATMGVEPC